MIYGDLDLEGDLFSAFAAMESSALRAPSPGQIVGMVHHFLALPTGGPPRPHGWDPARLRGAAHSRERDRAAIQDHSDVGNDFYGLWLDRNRRYSCGYFSDPDEELGAAQERKAAPIPMGWTTELTNSAFYAIIAEILAGVGACFTRPSS